MERRADGRVYHDIIFDANSGVQSVGKSAQRFAKPAGENDGGMQGALGHGRPIDEGVKRVQVRVAGGVDCRSTSAEVS